jgi:serine phosphatase RsbU (regulator of sigma subunit)
MKSEQVHEHEKEGSKHYFEFLRQQREIAESLKYASYIQQALFPAEALIAGLMPEHFIFYQPREMVSGDFYYVSGHNEYVFMAVGDCTGHGVPGAFMSLLGITFLNEIISRGNYFGAASILNHMREYVMKALCQTGEESEQKDGIDLALCILDTRKNKLDFAGAFNPAYIVRDQKLVELEGDNMPVGVGAEEEKPFTGHSFNLEDQDTLYLFTDGFADQFGGPKGKKFKYKPFRDMLLSGSHLSLPEQKLRIMKTFNSWKGNQRQLDDVLVCGFRYRIAGSCPDDPINS